MKLKHLLAAAIMILTVVGCASTPKVPVKTIPGLYTPAANEAVVYYKRADNDYSDWALHVWDGDVKDWTTWNEPFPLTGVSEKYGAYYAVPMKSADWQSLKFIVHMGDLKDLGGLDHTFPRADFGEDVFTYEDDKVLHADPKD